MKAVFLDRDGVINRTTPSGFVLKWEEFKFLPGISEAIKLLNKNNIPVFVISNQSCVGRGMVTFDAVKDINEKMIKELEKEGARISGVYFCPHAPEDGCDCRKPKPGMIKQAAKEHNIDLKGSWFIGDSQTDEQAGKAAGCGTVIVEESKPILPVITGIIGRIKA